MSESTRSGKTASPLWQLTVSSFKEFYREPIAIFWVYGFPLILCFILGLAFRNKPVEKIPIVVVQTDGPAVDALVSKLKSDPRLKIDVMSDSEARNEFRTAKASLVVTPTPNSPGYSYLFEPNRPESVLAKAAVDVALLRQQNPNMAVPKEETLTEPGGRYIDFLIPGLMGANLMGGGLWGVGFGIVDKRVKKLLKRLLATPMLKSDFIKSLVISRIYFTALQMAAFLLFAYLGYGIVVRGNYLALVIIMLLGTVCFSGFGLLVASRANKLESAQGLMNLVMLPSYLFSGVFFSSANFPDWSQPIISALPLTALNDGLRAVINDGAGLTGIVYPSIVMIGWSVVCYTIGGKLFRWL
ncbi:MAG: ABC transporter permease [Gemmataceae bacterium]